MGLLDIYNNPQSAGMMGLAQGLLQSSGASRLPVTMGQALGTGVQGMNQGFRQGQQNQFNALKIQNTKQAMQAQEDAKVKLNDMLQTMPDGPQKQQIAQAVALGVPADKIWAKLNPAPYTLSPGSVRYGADNQPVASVPVKIDYNQPFLPNGQPNKAYQDWKQSLTPNAIETAPNPATVGLKGEDFLNTLPASEKNIIIALDTGKMNPPSSFALKSPYWQKIYNDWAQYNPNLDAVNYGTRASTRKDFTSGASGKNLNALNTAIGHLGQLNQAIDALGNTSFTPYNEAKNLISKMTGNPAVTNFNTTKSAVANELMRVFRQSGASDAEIQEWAKPLNNSNSPDQLRGAVRTAAQLLQSRIEALNNTYNRGMGTANVDTLSTFISPHSRETLNALVGEGQVPSVQSAKFLGFE